MRETRARELWRDGRNRVFTVTLSSLPAKFEGTKAQKQTQKQKQQKKKSLERSNVRGEPVFRAGLHYGGEVHRS